MKKTILLAVVIALFLALCGTGNSYAEIDAKKAKEAIAEAQASLTQKKILGKWEEDKTSIWRQTIVYRSISDTAEFLKDGTAYMDGIKVKYTITRGYTSADSKEKIDILTLDYASGISRIEFMIKFETTKNGKVQLTLSELHGKTWHPGVSTYNKVISSKEPKEPIAPGKVVTLVDCSDFRKIYIGLGFAKDRLDSPPSRGEFESEEEYQKRLEKYKAEINKDVKQIHDQLYKVTLAYSNLIMRAPFYGITLKEPLKFCLPGYNLEEGYFALSNIKWAPETTRQAVKIGILYDFTVYSYLKWEEDITIKIEKSIARRVREIEDKLYLDLTFKVVDVDIERTEVYDPRDFFSQYIIIQPIKMTLRGEGETFWQWEKEE